MTLKKVTLVEIFDSDLDALLEMRGGAFASSIEETYWKILTAYLSGDTEQLANLIQALEQNPSATEASPALLPLARARLATRNRTPDPSLISELEKLALTQELWRGEIHFVLSNIASIEKRFDRERDLSLQAFHALKAIGARKKAVRALMNHIAAESCLRPEKHYLSDLYYVYREAKKSGDRTSIGTTLSNLSREYQKLGAISTALKYAQRAIAILSKNAGNLAYQLALAHRCHLFCQLGSFAEARVDAEMASCCDFIEVQAALAILAEQYPELRLEPRPTAETGPPQASATIATAATVTWQERKASDSRRNPASGNLTKLEQKLLELLCTGAKSKSELIEKLYGARLSRSATENRLNNLLNRLRKRHSGLIVFIEGKYRLSEDPFFHRGYSVSGN